MADFEKKTTLFDINVDIDSANKAVNDLTEAIIKNKDASKENIDEIKKLEKANKDLDKQVKSGTITTEQANKESQKNKDQIDQLRKSNFALGDELKKLNVERRNAVKVANLQAGSLDALRAKSIELKKQLNGVSTETEEGTKKFEALQSQLKEVNDKIVAADQGAGDFKTTIGRYREEVGKAIEDNKGLSGAFGRLKEGASSLFKTLLANPIGLLIAGFTALVAAIGKTSQGAKLFAQIGGFMKGLFSELIGLVDDLATFLTNAFKDPQQALKDFGNFLVDNIINRFTAVIDLGGALGNVLKNLLAGNFEEVKKSAANAGTALIQFGTGLDTEQQKKFANGLSNLTKEIGNTAMAFANLARAQKEVNQLNRESELQAAKLGAAEERLAAIRDDDTRSFEEREKAGREVFKLTQQRAEQEQVIALRNQKLLNDEIKLRQANGESIEELLDQKLQSDLAVVESQKAVTLAQLANQEEQSKLQRDIWEQDLDFAIDVGTRRTEEALKAAENEKASIEERQKSLNKARAVDEEAFNNQLKLFEEIGLSREKINQLTNESNAAVINSELKKTELNEIERNRFRELVLERQGLTEALNDTENTLLEAREERAQQQLENQQALNDKLNELDDFRREQENERILASIEEDQERFEVELEQLDERFEIKEERLAEQREIALENENLSKEERLALEADFQLQLEILQADGAAQRAALQAKVNKEELKKEKEKQDTRKKIIEDGFKVTQGISDAAFQTKFNKIDQQNRQETNALTKQLNDGQITREEFDQKKQELDKKSAIEAWRIQVKQFKTNKILASVENAINTAKGISNALGSFPPPASFVMAALVGILGVAQGVAIATQQPPPPPTFAKGGDVFGFTVGGKLHSEGGTKYVGEDGNRFEVEKGEGIFVTKREATNPAIQLLSEANTKFGGRSMFSTPKPFLQEGGQAAVTGLDSEAIGRAVANANATIPPPQVQVVDIMAGLQGNQEAENTGIV